MKLRILFTLAWRNLWRNYRRTVIMLMAIVLGVWAMIFMTAMMRGMVDDMVDSGIRHLPGHVQALHERFRDDPNIVNTISLPENAFFSGLDDNIVTAWTARLKVPAVISSEREVRGIQLVAVMPEREASMAFDTDQVKQGRWLESSDDQGIVIGAKLASRLETDLGKRVVVMSQDIDNAIAERGIRIVGVYQSNDVALPEDVFVYAGLETIQALLKAPGRVSQIAFEGEDYRNTQPLLTALKASRLSEQKHLVILAWDKLDNYLATTLSVMDGFVIVWILVIFLALSFGLINTLVMAVFERVREIGLMQALGMQPRLIMLQIICEALLLLLLGLMIGNVLAYLCILPIQDGIDISSVAKGMEMMGVNSVLYPSLYSKDIVTANLVVIVLGILASLLPAWRAARYDPIVALNKT